MEIKAQVQAFLGLLKERLFPLGARVVPQWPVTKVRCPQCRMCRGPASGKPHHLTAKALLLPAGVSK